MLGWRQILHHGFAIPNEALIQEELKLFCVDEDLLKLSGERHDGVLVELHTLNQRGAERLGRRRGWRQRRLQWFCERVHIRESAKPHPALHKFCSVAQEP